MREALFTQHGIDYQDAMYRFMDEDLYVMMLRDFPNDASYKDMVEAIANGDAALAFEAAHALKGLTGNLAMASLYKDVCVLVEELRIGDLSNTESSLPPIQKGYDAMVAFIQTLA